MANDGDGKRRPRLSDEERRAAVERLVQCRIALTEEEIALLREVFPEIFEAHYDDVWEVVRKRGLEQADAEDLVQSVYLTAFRWIVAKGFPPNFAAWLTVVARGKLKNFVRGCKRSPMSVGLPSSGSMPPGSPPRPESGMDRKALAARLLPLLPEPLRQVVTLVLCHGLSHAEAGRALDIPTGTVTTRLMKAKPMLVELAKQFLTESERGIR